jgi:xanthine dehydrogenase accessory factor
MSDWLQALADLDAAGTPHVLITQIEALGSTPREKGAKMVVTADHLFDTIGGGSLEFQAAAVARGLLTEGRRGLTIEKSILGPDMRQCCGGAVTLLFEPFYPARLTLAVFGAGHVAQALVRILDGVPLRMLWIDERPGVFPPTLPAFVSPHHAADPVALASSLPALAHVLVMTHSHERDYQVIRALADRQDLASLGMIGSATKWARFRHRLAEDGLAAERIAAIRCPIGLKGLKGKRPAEIAIGIAAELLLSSQSPPE